MFSVFNRVSLLDSGILRGFTDYHSHILPGVDDGIQNMDESLKALEQLEAWGVNTLWLTPHVMEDIPNTTGFLKERFAQLESAYTGKITLHLSAEYMLDNLFGERLQQHDLLPMGTKKDHLLVETSYFNPPIDLARALEQIRQQGYHPILAHPERYAYMSEADYRLLKAQSVKFQLNLSSLSGVYGNTVRKKAAYLLKKGMYDVSGTDLHALHSFTNLASSRVYNSLYSRLASKQGQALQI